MFYILRISIYIADFQKGFISVSSRQQYMYNHLKIRMSDKSLRTNLD